MGHKSRHKDVFPLWNLRCQETILEELKIRSDSLQPVGHKVKEMNEIKANKSEKGAQWDSYVSRMDRSQKDL